jgi:motility quorum-sensing regulator / GCU-specific mRNA interferase toxin
MEKRRPHYPLTLVQQLAAEPACIRFTRTALDGAAELGFDVTKIQAVVMKLRPADFYKSMTTYADASIWHDVYRPIVNGTPMYIKLTVYAAENLLVVSFKRR